MKNLKTSLPFAIRYALAMYYLNRSRVYDVTMHCRKDMPPLTVVESGYKWDKQADLDAIAKATRKLGWGFSATAGTFWFYRPGVKKYHYHVNEDSFPQATRLPIKQIIPE